MNSLPIITNNFGGYMIGAGSGCSCGHVGSTGGNDVSDAAVRIAEEGGVADVSMSIDVGFTSRDANFTTDTGQPVSLTDGGVVRPQTPMAPSATFVMNMPCAFPASVSYEQRTNTLLTTCATGRSSLYRSPALNSSGNWALVGSVTGIASNHAEISPNQYLITRANPDGFDVIDGRTGNLSSSVNFSDLATIINSLGFTPNNPTGVVLAGAQVCMTTSNLDLAHTNPGDPSQTVFNAGTILCFSHNGGAIDRNSARQYMTSAKNPTGAVNIDQTHFAVLNSNTYNRRDGDATLDIFEFPSMNRTASHNLGRVTAQISPALAFEGGKVFVGVQGPNAMLKTVDPASGMVANYPLYNGQGYISSVAAWSAIAAVSDFNNNNVFFVDTSPSGWVGILTTNVNSFPGPSVVVGDSLYQVVSGGSSDAQLKKIGLQGLRR